MEFNYLIDDYPTCLVVDDVEYSINTDFRVILAILRVLDDPSFTAMEKEVVACGMFYKNVPEDIERAFVELQKFINLFEKSESKKEKEDRPTFDFNKDSRLILSFFYQIYRIDLTEVNMHWFKFMALLTNMSSERTLLEDVIYIRGAELTNNMSAQYRAQLIKLKERYSLAEVTKKDKSKAIGNALAFAFKE